MTNVCKILFSLFFIFFASLSVAKSEEEFKFHLQPRPAPLSSFEDEYRSSLRLINFKGKIIVLNLWATYCAPCIKELQSLDKLSEDMGRKINIIAVSVGKETGAEVRSFYEKYGIKFLDVYTDRSRLFNQELGIDSVPITLLVNANGVEVARVLGKIEFDSSSIKAQIKNLLRKF